MVPHYRKNSSIYENLEGDIRGFRFLDKLQDTLHKHNITVFINNAAVYLSGSIVDMADCEIDEVIETNLIAQIKMLKRVYKVFRDKGKGKIININSLAGKFPSAKESLYCASKAGLDAFSKSLQLEAIGTGVEIVDVYPGAMRTKMTGHRGDQETMMSPKEVAMGVLDTLDNSTYYVNELVLRKRNERRFTN